MNRYSTIELRIDELVVHGMAPAQAQRLAESMKNELARLIAQNGWPDRHPRSGERDQVLVSMPSLAAGTASAGVQIAGAIYGGLRP